MAQVAGLFKLFLGDWDFIPIFSFYPCSASAFTDIWEVVNSLLASVSQINKKQDWFIFFRAG